MCLFREVWEGKELALTVHSYTYDMWLIGF